MKRAMLTAGMVIGATVLLTGCRSGRLAAGVAYVGKVVAMQSEPGPTVTESTADHLHRINAAIEMDQRAYFDDLDILFMQDRPTRLTRWAER